MRWKRALIKGLVGINLALLMVLASLSYDPPTAYAQRAGRGGNYVAVTAIRFSLPKDIIYTVPIVTNSR